MPGRPPISVAHLVTAALRHRPDRIIIGEVRDHSAYDMLHAMNTGHCGSMTTVHADAASLPLTVWLTWHYPLMSTLITHSSVRKWPTLPFRGAGEQARDGTRRITEVVQVQGYDSTHHVFPHGIDFIEYSRPPLTPVYMKGEALAKISSGR